MAPEDEHIVGKITPEAEHVEGEMAPEVEHVEVKVTAIVDSGTETNAIAEEHLPSAQTQPSHASKAGKAFRGAGGEDPGAGPETFSRHSANTRQTLGRHSAKTE